MTQMHLCACSREQKIIFFVKINQAAHELVFMSCSSHKFVDVMILREQRFRETACGSELDRHRLRSYSIHVLAMYSFLFSLDTPHMRGDLHFHPGSRQSYIPLYRHLNCRRSNPAVALGGFLFSLLSQ